MSGINRQPFSSLVVLVVLWHLSCGQSKDHLDPNTRDWGDYSDLQGLGHGLGLDREEEDGESSHFQEEDFLSDFAGNIINLHCVVVERWPSSNGREETLKGRKDLEYAQLASPVYAVYLNVEPHKVKENQKGNSLLVTEVLMSYA
jgi:hypothetical protein